MSPLNNKLYFQSVMLTMLCCLFLTQTAHSELLEKDPKKAENKPIVIKSSSMEMDNKLKLVTFTGDVKAEKDDFTITCEKMLVYYVAQAQQDDSKSERTQLNKIIATGRVIINRGQGGVATADEATYFQDGEKMILTGNPIVTRGADVVKGNRITIFLAEDRVKVEGTPEQGVNLTIAPRHEEK